MLFEYKDGDFFILIYNFRDEWKVLSNVRVSGKFHINKIELLGTGSNDIYEIDILEATKAHTFRTTLWHTACLSLQIEACNDDQWLVY